MSRDPYEFDVIACLEESGYKVTAIDEDNTSKRADLLAKSVTDTLLVEVKRKYDDDDLYELLCNTEPDKIIPYRASVAHSNSISAVIKEASQQINESKQLAKDAYGVLWFHPDPKLGFTESPEQIKMNLYGGRWAFVDTSDGSHSCMPCYYCTYSDFYRHAALDCVILHSKDGCVLMPNAFSSRVDGFHQSSLYQDFESHSAIWRPEVLEEAGEALCLKGTVDVKDVGSVRQQLSIQYPKHKINFVDINAYGGVTKIENKPLDEGNL